MAAARRWAADQARRDIEWALYEALKASLAAPLPVPSAELLVGFYGRDWDE